MNYKEKEELFIKEFTIKDANEVEHKAILVGILKSAKWSERFVKSRTIDKKNGKVVINEFSEEICASKEFSMGLAINNPDDSFDYNLGLNIAKGRASKENKRIGLLVTEDSKMLGTEMCEAILKQQIEYIQNHPEKFFIIKRK